MHKPRAALYLRLSDDARGTGENVSDQEAGARRLAASLGAVVTRVYNDNDFPASDPKRKPRPDFDMMLKDAADGQFDLLVVRHADRLYRTPHDLGRITDAFGPRRITVHQEWAGHPLDLSTPTGLLNAGIMAQVAKYETDHKRERQQAMNRARAASGEPPVGGPIPFGFQKDRKSAEPKTAAMVREAHTALLRGDSLRSIIRAWNSSGITAPRGGKWTYSNVRGVLTRPLNAGFVLYDGVVLPGIEGKWERLVTAEEHHAVAALLADPSRRTTDTSRRKHFLPGIARCGTCGSGMRSGVVGMRPLKGETAPRKHRIYRCINADCAKPVRIAMEKLDAEVERRFLEERGEEATVKIIRFDADQAAALADVEARIKGITARLGEDGAEVEELMQRLGELKAERATIKKTPSRELFKAGQVKLDWEAAEGDLERRREILLGHLEDGGLRIAPRGKVTHRFDPTRVEIAWRELGPVADVEYVRMPLPR